jgi:hypothetical protein
LCLFIYQFTTRAYKYFLESKVDLNIMQGLRNIIVTGSNKGIGFAIA